MDDRRVLGLAGAFYDAFLAADPDGPARIVRIFHCLHNPKEFAAFWSD